MSLLPSCWGPLIWTYCHSIAYVYDPSKENETENYYNYFKDLGKTLPCSECREHYEDVFDEESLEEALDSNEQMFRWVYDLHNLVNERLGVPKNKWPSYEEVKKRYAAYSASSCTETEGMCGARKENSSKKIILVEQFGTFNDEQYPYVLSTALFLFFLIVAMLYIRYLKNSIPKSFKRH
jgi:hypothetical protein